MRKKLNIPALFLTALALGMWVGASWHSALQPSFNVQPGAACSSCCRLVASVSKQSTKTQINATAYEGRAECAACLAGALVYDAPGAATFALEAHAAPGDSSPHLSGILLTADVHSHPPERGPPA